MFIFLVEYLTPPLLLFKIEYILQVKRFGAGNIKQDKERTKTSRTKVFEYNSQSSHRNILCSLSFNVILCSLSLNVILKE